MAAFPFPVIIAQGLLLIVASLLVWAKVLLACVYMVVKYGIFYGV